MTMRWLKLKVVRLGAMSATLAFATVSLALPPSGTGKTTKHGASPRTARPNLALPQGQPGAVWSNPYAVPQRNRPLSTPLQIDVPIQPSSGLNPLPDQGQTNIEQRKADALLELAKQGARQKYNAMKPPNASGWRCNAYQALHSGGPNECADPHKGGHWETTPARPFYEPNSTPANWFKALQQDKRLNDQADEFYSNQNTLRRYGQKRNGMKPHGGNDMSASPGTPIPAPVSGTIYYVTPKKGWIPDDVSTNYSDLAKLGNVVIIKDQNGVLHEVGHLMQGSIPSYLRSGMTILKGQRIGAAGTSGNAGAHETPPHVHYQQQIKGKKGTIPFKLPRFNR